MRLIILVIFIVTFVSACQQRNFEILVINGLTMGTTYSIKIKTRDNKANKNHIYNDIEHILFKINHAMSTYIKDSELSKINLMNNSSWQPVSDDLFKVINHANDVSIKTNGAFDITIGPLVNLWGFGPDKSKNKVPNDETVKIIKKNTGFKKILLNKKLKMVSKTDPNLYIDLSGIAKGFAVDKIANYLDTYDFKNYLIEIGGELIGKGTNIDKKPWIIGIQNPSNDSQSIKRTIQLKNIAMATSGDYKNYFVEDGIRYSHTIDPNSGKPVKHELVSVTILDNSAMNADALATAFMVLGPEKTLLIANELEVAVYLIIKNEEKFEEIYNDIFASFLLN